MSGKWSSRMSPRLGVFVLAVLLISLIPLLRAESQSTAPSASKNASPVVSAGLPAGAMRTKATTACLECHEARIILQQRLSKPTWGKEVDKMVKWGAIVDPNDRDALVDYLSLNFGSDKPPYTADRTSRNKP